MNTYVRTNPHGMRWRVVQGGETGPPENPQLDGQTTLLWPCWPRTYITAHLASGALWHVACWSVARCCSVAAHGGAAVQRASHAFPDRPPPRRTAAAGGACWAWPQHHKSACLPCPGLSYYGYYGGPGWRQAPRQKKGKPGGGA